MLALFCCKYLYMLPVVKTGEQINSVFVQRTSAQNVENRIVSFTVVGEEFRVVVDHLVRSQ